MTGKLILGRFILAEPEDIRADTSEDAKQATEAMVKLVEAARETVVSPVREPRQRLERALRELDVIWE